MSRVMPWLLTVLLVTGSLTLAGAFFQPAATRLVFVGSYTGENSRGIYSFRFDDVAGTLTPMGLAVETPNPSFLTASADGRFVYAVNEIDKFSGAASGSVTAFAVNTASATLTPLNTVSSEGASPCHVMLDRSGKFLAVANYMGGTFAVLPVEENGRLGTAVSVMRNAGQGPTSRQEGPHAHAVLFDSTNRFLLGADLGLDRVFVYRFNAATGAATPHDPASISLDPGSGPRHLAFSPTSPLAFVISELASTTDSLDWDEMSGRLEPKASYSTLPEAYRGMSATAEIEVDAGGHFVYGSNRGHDSIAVFAVSDDGQLALVEHELTRGRTPRHFKIDPTGRWLVAANQDSNTLAVFAIDQVTGRLEPVGPLTNAAVPTSVLFVPSR